MMASPPNSAAKVQLLLLLALANIPQAEAITAFAPDSCEILGDPDVYGPGIRLGFYLQWAAIVIFLLFSPDEAHYARNAMNITLLAVYINAFRNAMHGSLVFLDFQILWEIMFILIFFNWPTTLKGLKRNSASLSVSVLLIAIYFVVQPWIAFWGLEVGRKRGCDLYVQFFVNINVYSEGYVTATKVLSILGVFGGAAFLLGAICLLGYWTLAGWCDENVQEYQERWNFLACGLGIITIVMGAIGISTLEKLLQINHVQFPDTDVASGAQLISLLIGIFTLTKAVVSAFGAFFRGEVFNTKLWHRGFESDDDNISLPERADDLEHGGSTKHNDSSKRDQDQNDAHSSEETNAANDATPSSSNRDSVMKPTSPSNENKCLLETAAPLAKVSTV